MIVGCVWPKAVAVGDPTLWMRGIDKNRGEMLTGVVGFGVDEGFGVIGHKSNPRFKSE